MRQSIAFLFVVCLAALPIAQTRSAKSLDLYLIDVEGGGATLFVAPSGESVLIDTGNGGAAAARDAGRIMGNRRLGSAVNGQRAKRHHDGDNRGGSE